MLAVKIYIIIRFRMKLAAYINASVTKKTKLLSEQLNRIDNKKFDLQIYGEDQFCG